jgi:dolichol-phosphate mannosyltransferase
VRNVPGWRLFLSKGASLLYRRVLRNKLATYTSCFRVYRRAAVKDVSVRSANFLGVVELLGHLDQKGSRIVEHPAVLDVRVLGRSKMKTLRTIAGHLKLMGRLAAGRLKRRRRAHTAAERNRALHLLMDTATTTPCHVGLETPKPVDQPSGALS